MFYFANKNTAIKRCNIALISHTIKTTGELIKLSEHTMHQSLMRIVLHICTLIILVSPVRLVTIRTGPQCSGCTMGRRQAGGDYFMIWAMF